MRYGHPYMQTRVADGLIDFALDHREPMKDGQISGQSTVTRSSKIAFIKDRRVLEPFMKLAQDVNKSAGWHFYIDAIEPMQYGEYHFGNEYGWHVDQHSKPYKDGRVRKFSFSIFLNDDFEGGEFDLEIHNPNVNPRYITIDKLSPNTAVFFQADVWHRVRPVTMGIRRSLVGWVLGPRFR